MLRKDNTLLVKSITMIVAVVQPEPAFCMHVAKYSALKTSTLKMPRLVRWRQCLVQHGETCINEDERRLSGEDAHRVDPEFAWTDHQHGRNHEVQDPRSHSNKQGEGHGKHPAHRNNHQSSNVGARHELGDDQVRDPVELHLGDHLLCSPGNAFREHKRADKQTQPHHKILAPSIVRRLQWNALERYNEEQWNDRSDEAHEENSEDRGIPAIVVECLKALDRAFAVDCAQPEA
ncbi:TPA: hypothetical protein N0F65_001678 [Lagenidium giganteum]|uniref:Uncharacterized protein n=1 Tax=Lagenidium giganteum TaxID=4803 RepID=A0AAV2Z1M5_9STRA|nr:TPA: hypothetical protein N0F65_001678 [Lagenidium giganteum]